MASIAQDSMTNANGGIVYDYVLKQQVSDLVSTIHAALSLSSPPGLPEVPESTQGNSSTVSTIHAALSLSNPPGLSEVSESTQGNSSTDDSSSSGDNTKGTEVSEPELELEPEADEVPPKQDSPKPKGTPEKKSKTPRSSRKRFSLIDLAEKQQRQQRGNGKQTTPAVQEPDNCGYPQFVVEMDNATYPRNQMPKACVWCGGSVTPNSKFCMFCGTPAAFAA
jgi:hypothetical protein